MKRWRSLPGMTVGQHHVHAQGEQMIVMGVEEGRVGDLVEVVVLGMARVIGVLVAREALSVVVVRMIVIVVVRGVPLKSAPSIVQH